MRLLMKLLFALASFLGVVTAISGCTGDDPVDRSSFQQQIIHAVCDTVQECCITSERGFNSVNCVQKVAQDYAVPLSDGNLSYDPQRAGRCIQQITQAAQACQPFDVTSCYDAFVGHVPVGGQCAQAFDCDPGPNGFAVCNLTTNLCEQPARGTQGAPCSYSCVDSANFPQCHSPQGMAAGDAAACHSIDGLVCVAAPTGVATCQPLAADCAQNPTGSCPPGYLCNTMTSQCYVPAPVGGSCAQVLCIPGAYCAAGVCYPVKPNTAPCGGNTECASNRCEKGLCVANSPAADAWCGESTAGQ